MSALTVMTLFILAKKMDDVAEAHVLEEVLEESVQVPRYQLEMVESVFVIGSVYNFTCIAVTDASVRAVFSWFRDDTAILGMSESTIPFRQGKMAFAYALASIRKSTTKLRVQCRIDVTQARGTSQRVTLSTDLPFVTNALHLVSGTKCGIRERRCVGEHVTCNRKLSNPLCTCKPGASFHQHDIHMCALHRKHGDMCLFDNQCQSGTEQCADNRCACRKGLVVVNSVCAQNSTLNSICDENRVCPSGSHCLNSVCACRKDFYEWKDECRKRSISEEEAKYVVVVLVSVSTLLFIVIMWVLGYFFYKHSYRPSTMYERSGSSWDYGTSASLPSRKIPDQIVIP